MKECSKCKVEKELSEFNKSRRNKSGLRAECRPCQNVANKAYYNSNPDRDREYYEKNKADITIYKKQWRSKNKEVLAVKSKAYREERKEKIREDNRNYRLNNKEKRNAYERRRRAECAEYRTITNMRTRMNKVLAGTSKHAPTRKLLGCSLEHFHFHIESQFTEGMSWDNYGLDGWVYDHIQACSNFNQKDPEQQKICWHYTNYQPMWNQDNCSKRDEVVAEHQVNLL